MKKQSKGHKSHKPSKKEVNSKSKTNPNSSMNTPKTVSPRNKQEETPWIDSITEEKRSSRHSSPFLRARPSHHRYQHRATTDQYKPGKKMEEHSTGTQTPLVKRVSLTSEIGKKKSTGSLTSTEKQRPKIKSKTYGAKSGQLSHSTFQRLISVMIKDYREGKLKEREFEQTLMQLFDKKQTKSPKKRKQSFSGFTNDFLKTTQTRSEALVRRRNNSGEIEERVLERKGFVNKIIIKGITTSLFLKEEANLSHVKERDEKPSNNPEMLQNIYTSSSVKELTQDIKTLNAKYKHTIFVSSKTEQSLFDKMATRIQRAWRRHQTRKIISKIKQMASSSVENQPEEFTESEDDADLSQPNFIRHSSQVPSTNPDQIAELVKVITQSLQSSITKEECLRSILECLHVPQELVSIPEMQELDIEANIQEVEPNGHSQSSGSDEYDQVIKVSRVKMLGQEENQSPDAIEPILSNDLNSFTNKFSSKQVEEDYVVERQSLDQSLTFAQPHILNQDSFKSISIQSIEEGLRAKEETLQVKKVKEVERITEQYFNNRINKEVYLQEKTKIDKWFNSQLKELRSVKKSLLKSCSQAQEVLETGLPTLNTEKSKKMLKCLSDKYIKKEWSIASRNDMAKKKQQKVESEGECFGSAELRSQDDCLQHNEDDLNVMCFQSEDSIEKQMKRHAMLSPKLPRHDEEEEEETNQPINHYQFEQLEKMIEEEEEALEDGLPQLETKRVISDKFPETTVEKDDVESHQLSLIHSLLNQTSKKFKYLCNEDKQDIFEFLFLDLILEPFTDPYSGQARVLRSAESYINHLKRIKKIPKGIKTNLPASKDYLKTLSEYVMKDRGSLKNLSLPMGPSAPEMLRYMRDQIVEMQQESVSTTLVLPLDVFEIVGQLPEVQLKAERYYEDEEREQSRVSFLKTALHIHHKALFDSINQMLDHERPYGVWGKPFPWKKSLSIERRWCAEKEREKLRKAVERTVESCSYLCGILVDKEDSLFGSHKVSNDYVFQIREDRLSKMLANQLIENEQRWIFYDDEETEILMEVTTFVANKIIKDFVIEFKTLQLQF